MVRLLATAALVQAASCCVPMKRTVLQRPEVSVTVTTPDEAPVAGARVYFRRSDHMAMPVAVLHASEATTDADGGCRAWPGGMQGSCSRITQVGTSPHSVTDRHLSVTDGRRRRSASARGATASERDARAGAPWTGGCPGHVPASGTGGRSIPVSMAHLAPVGADLHDGWRWESAFARSAVAWDGARCADEVGMLAPGVPRTGGCPGHVPTSGTGGRSTAATSLAGWSRRRSPRRGSSYSWPTSSSSPARDWTTPPVGLLLLG
jgi:hypothetical protein